MLRKPPYQVYASDKSNPPYYFFGYFTVWTGQYVEYRKALEFTEQVVLQYYNNERQNAEMILGAATRIVENMVTLGGAMTPPALLVSVAEDDVEYEICPYTEIKFKLVFGTRIQATLIGFPLIQATGQKTVSDTSYPLDSVPPYPIDRPRIEDPPRSPPYEDEVPGDTAPATPEDPDSSLTSGGGEDPPPSPDCYKVTAYGSTSERVPGTLVQSNGAPYPSWRRANSISTYLDTIQSTDSNPYYAGCLAYFLTVDGIPTREWSPTWDIEVDNGNPNCPA